MARDIEPDPVLDICLDPDPQPWPLSRPTTRKQRDGRVTRILNLDIKKIMSEHSVYYSFTKQIFKLFKQILQNCIYHEVLYIASMGKLQTYFISNKLSSDIIKPGEYFLKFKTMSTIPASLYDRQGKTFPPSRKNPPNLNQIKNRKKNRGKNQGNS